MIVIGLVFTFVVAAIIEAIVTPSGLPTAARVGIGVAVEAVFLAYIVSRGRQAEAVGLTGCSARSARRRSRCSWSNG